MPPKTLYEYYTQQGSKLPTVEERSGAFEAFGLGEKEQYIGSARQNTELLNRLLGETGEERKEPAVISTANADKEITNMEQQVQQRDEAVQAVEEKRAQRTREQQESALFAEEEQETELTETQKEQKRLQGLVEQAFIDRQQSYDDMVVANTKVANAYVQQLKNQWEEAKKAQIRANVVREGVYSQAGFRTGQTRYAPQHQADVMQEIQSQGIERLRQLDNKYQSAITEAENAMESKNYELAYQKSQEAQEYYTNTLQEIQRQEQETAKLTAELLKQEGKAKVGDAVYNALAEGLETTTDIYASLRNMGVDVTPQEVDDIIKTFIPKKSIDTTKHAFEFGKDATGKLIALGMTGEDIQVTQDLVNKYGLYGNIEEADGASLQEILDPKQFAEIKSILYPPPKQPAQKGIKSNDMDYNTSILVSRLGKNIYGTRISDKESDRVENFVRLGMQEGKDEYDIVDDVLGYKITRNKPLSEGLRNTILRNAGEEGLSGFDMMGLARLINGGNDVEAVRKVENFSLGDDYELEADIDYVNNKIKDINQLLGQGWSNEVGKFEGKFSVWLNETFGTGEAAKIRAKLGSLTAELINKRAGSALTDSEWNRLISANVPEFDESANTWRGKLQELIDDPLEKYNSLRRIKDIPELTLEDIEEPSKRIRYYAGNQEQEVADFLDTFDMDYDENEWANFE